MNILLINTILLFISVGLRVYLLLKKLFERGEKLDGRALAAGNKLVWMMNEKLSPMLVQCGCAPEGVPDESFDSVVLMEDYKMSEEMKALHPLPTSFPTEALPMVLDWIRGKQPVNKIEAYKIAYHLVGYFIWRMEQTGDEGKIAMGAAPLKGEELCSAIEAEFSEGMKSGDGSILQSIINGILDLIQGLLTK